MLIKSLKNIAKGGLLTLATVTAAQAAILTTPPLNSDSTQHFHCSIANIGTKPVEVILVEAIGSGGTVLSSNSDFTLAPGEILNSANDTVSDAFCRFTVKGSPKKVRAGMSVEDSLGYMTMFLPATL